MNVEVLHPIELSQYDSIVVTADDSFVVTADDSLVVTADDSLAVTADDSLVVTADDSLVVTADDSFLTTMMYTIMMKMGVGGSQYLAIFRRFLDFENFHKCLTFLGGKNTFFQKVLQ